MEALHIDIAVTGDVFTEQMRSTMRSQRICVEPIRDETTGAVTYVDRIEIGNTTSIREEQMNRQMTLPVGTLVAPGRVIFDTESMRVPSVVIAQPVVLYLTSEQILRRLAGSPPRTDDDYALPPLGAVLQVRLSADASEGVPSLTTELLDIDLPLLRAIRDTDSGQTWWALWLRYKPQVMGQVAPLVRSSRSLDLSAAAGIVGQPMSALKAAVAYDSETRRMVIRIEISRRYLNPYQESELLRGGGHRGLGGRPRPNREGTGDAQPLARFPRAPFRRRARHGRLVGLHPPAPARSRARAPYLPIAT